VIRLHHAYLLAGAFLAWTALGALRRLRIASALFWGLLAAAFLAGDRIRDGAMGALVLALAVLGAFLRGEARGREEGPPSPGGILFLPALLIPALTLACVLGLRKAAWNGAPLLEPANATLVSLALACAGALAAALAVTRRWPWTAGSEGGRLLEAIGGAAILPLLLATLGAVFSACGVGTAMARLLREALPMDHRLVAVLAYGLGMALLTMVMGNAFAAFPVMTAGIGLPILVRLHGANPAAVGALGMLSGYCGTLLTPMAANYNIVPAALLELPDPHGVIKAQVPTAAVLLPVNLALIWFLAFR
jgi:uncharacterized membrane protein